MQNNAKKALQKRKELLESIHPLSSYNPYNPNWTKQILKNHFDIDLKVVKDKDHPGKATWKIRKIKNPRREIRAADREKEKSADSDMSNLLDKPYGEDPQHQNSAINHQKLGRRTDGFNIAKNNRGFEKRSQTQNAQRNGRNYLDKRTAVNNYVRQVSLFFYCFHQFLEC